MEMLHTWPKALDSIVRPFLPDICISPIWTEVGKGHAIIQVFVPVIPDIIWLIIVSERGSRRLTLKLSHVRLYPHRQQGQRTALHTFYKVVSGSP
jgi:hypothetical protein